MFAIRLLPTSECGPTGERMGEITVGDFTERFVCLDQDLIEVVWKSQLQDLLNEKLAIALVFDPRAAWIVYRQGDLCFVQQQVSLDGQFNKLMPRETKSDDGVQVSEWSTTTMAIRQFLQA